jgi:hypothetical protein
MDGHWYDVRPSQGPDVVRFRFHYAPLPSLDNYAQRGSG